MFKKEAYNQENYKTFIGLGTEIEGTFTLKESARIDGNIKGDIVSKEKLVIGTKSNVEGSIQTKDISIAGAVRGNIRATGRIEMLANCKVFGDIVAASISIDEKAVYQGKCETTAAEGIKEVKESVSSEKV